MMLTPSGKTRVMVAQQSMTDNPLSSGQGESPNVEKQTMPLSTEKAMDEDIGETAPGTSPVTGQPSDINVNEKKNTLSNYIFKKLESYGYPGRRLQEFKSKFVRESVTPDGIKDVQVEIPDKKYPGPDGTAETIESRDLKEMTDEIKEFGLNFNGAERSDGKWTIKFTSQRVNDPDEQGGMVRDNLDEVYGTPTSANKGKPGKSKMASNLPTIYEMIKDSKNLVVPQLLKQNGA